MRMQQSTPDGLLPRHVVDRDYELWLYPNLADVLRLRIRAVVNEVEALQKDHERAYKRSGRGR
jgi:hypothetical protein